MDALLAGYGSDDSSGSSSDGGGVGGVGEAAACTPAAQDAAASRGLPASAPPPVVVVGRRPRQGGTDASAETGFPGVKADGKYDDPALSLAKLSSASMIGWPRDYLTPLHRSAEQQLGASCLLLAQLRRAQDERDEKLDRILSVSPSTTESGERKKSRLDGSGDGRSTEGIGRRSAPRSTIAPPESYARLLQSDHDFLNPHQLEAAAAGLGIRRAMGSTLDDDDDPGGCDNDEAPAS